jgi:hypothetical protein
MIKKNPHLSIRCLKFCRIFKKSFTGTKIEANRNIAEDYFFIYFISGGLILLSRIVP